MSFFMSLGNGPKFFFELTARPHRDVSRTRGYEVRRENGETLIWLGRLHVIYTPGHWRPTPRGPTNDGCHHDTHPSRDRRMAS